MTETSGNPSTTVIIRKTHVLLWAITVGIAIAVTWWVSKKRNEAILQAYNETASAQFQKISDRVAQMEGHVVTTGQLEDKVKAAMGSELTQFVSAQNGVMTSLTTAIGQLNGSITHIQAPIAGGIKTDTGGFQNVKLLQDRGKAPALTSILLNYDPKLPGFSGLTGSWINNTEKFTASYGEWRTEHDGMRSAARLRREIYDLAGNKIGEEEIPLVNGDAYFSSDQLARTTPSSTHQIMLGSSYDAHTGKQHISGIYGEQVTPSWGVATGYVNNGWVVMTSYRWGHK